MSMDKHLLIVISGPSGVGKGTVARALLARNPNIAESVSATTRAPRPGEREGREYFFLERDAFERGIEEDSFLEHSRHFENYYGTPRAYVEKTLERKDVLLEIDVNGALAVKAANPDAVLIMVVPPTIGELNRRLSGRNTETEDKIALRLSRAAFELGLYDKYDYVVVNDRVEAAAERIEGIITAEKCRAAYQGKRIQKIMEGI